MKERNLHVEFEVIQHTNDIQRSKSRDHSVGVSPDQLLSVVLLYAYTSLLDFCCFLILFLDPMNVPMLML